VFADEFIGLRRVLLTPIDAEQFARGFEVGLISVDVFADDEPLIHIGFVLGVLRQIGFVDCFEVDVQGGSLLFAALLRCDVELSLFIRVVNFIVLSLPFPLHANNNKLSSKSMT
jgi:hypothetical protein